jgi:hypothetical protein
MVLRQVKLDEVRLKDGRRGKKSHPLVANFVVWHTNANQRRNIFEYVEKNLAGAVGEAAVVDDNFCDERSESQKVSVREWARIAALWQWYEI